MPYRRESWSEPGPPLPIETLRHWYVTVCGGLSPDLALHQIGINRKALERNTDLNPSVDRVRVAVVGAQRRPLLMDRFFEIVPLDERTPEAAALSPQGEAVFPEGDDVLRPRESPQPGQQVILNSLASRLEGLPDSQAFARILEEIFRGNPPQNGENA